MSHRPLTNTSSLKIAAAYYAAWPCRIGQYDNPMPESTIQYPPSQGLRIWLLFSPPLHSAGCRHFFSCPRRLTFWSCQHGRCTDLPRRIRGTEGRRNAQIQPDQKCKVIILGRREVRFNKEKKLGVFLGLWKHFFLDFGNTFLVSFRILRVWHVHGGIRRTMHCRLCNSDSALFSKFSLGPYTERIDL